MVIIDRRHWQHTTEILNGEGDLLWKKPFSRPHILRIDGADIKLEPINMGQVADKSTAIARTYTTFVNTMKALVSYTGSFKIAV